MRWLPIFWTILVVLFALGFVVTLVAPFPRPDQGAPSFVRIVAWWLAFLTWPLAILFATTWKARLALVGTVALTYGLTAWAAGWSGCPPGYGHGGACDHGLDLKILLMSGFVVGGMLLLVGRAFRWLTR
jgi:hypothetical protein